MDLFVYGTLRSPQLMTAVAGMTPTGGASATLPGFALHPLAGNVVPFIAPDPGAEVAGLIWDGIDDAAFARLDLYEGAFGYVRDTIVVTTAAGERKVACYMPPPGLQAGPGPWSLAVWEADHLAPACLAAAEVFAEDPPPDPATLRRMWPMIEARAWSRHRAKAAPAAQRFAAAPGDFAIIEADPPTGRFFRFQAMNVRHRTFDGAQSDIMRREAFIGIDAAIVLPYDPVRDRVLLVEQARLGPRLRHDPNPWMLEPVAGIVDAREHPAEAARREGMEEAGVAFSELLPAGQFYVSPGASSDYFHTYVGLCDLPMDAPYAGGLPEEGEDLRVHPLSFDAAMDLADSGEIATGPAMFLLYWLLRHRDRIRGTGAT